MQPKSPYSSPKFRKRGFQQAGGVLASKIRSTAESRGFSQTQIITRWREIVGPDIARIADPVKVTYANKGIGATLVVLTKGAFGPELEMQKPRIRELVNQVYGYNAIARIHVTQTAATGFAESQTPFETAPPELPVVDPSEMHETVAPITSDGLRDALAQLGANIKSRKSSQIPQKKVDT